MSQVARVYLLPSNPQLSQANEEARGYVTKLNEIGVWVDDREDGRGASHFFPTHRIIRIDYNVGW